jgi:hypothetical protein
LESAFGNAERQENHSLKESAFPKDKALSKSMIRSIFQRLRFIDYYEASVSNPCIFSLHSLIGSYSTKITITLQQIFHRDSTDIFIAAIKNEFSKTVIADISSGNLFKVLSLRLSYLLSYISYLSQSRIHFPLKDIFDELQILLWISLLCLYDANNRDILGKGKEI